MESKSKSEEEKEHIIGGFMSPSLRYGMTNGYGIYVTNKRLIGLRPSRENSILLFMMVIGAVIGFSFGSVLLAVLLLVVLGMFGAMIGGGMTSLYYVKLGQKISRIDEKKMLKELEQRKEISLSKDKIESLELKPPTSLGRGHFRIKTKSGKTMKIMIPHVDEYVKLRRIIRAFYPEVLTLLEK